MKSAFKNEQGMRVIHKAVRSLYSQNPAKMESRYLDTGEFGETHVLSAGPDDAPPLVLLHGTSSNSLTWLGYVPLWSKKFRVHAPDIPGQPGLSSRLRPNLADGSYNRWLEKTLGALKCGSVNLAGRSMGGLIALDFAATRPEMVRSLILFSPGGLAPPRFSFFFRILPLVFFGKAGAGRINRIVSGGAKINPQYEAFSLLVSRHFIPVTERIPVFSEERIHGLRIPVFYLAGEKDAMLRTRESAERLKALVPEAEIHVLKNVGHVVTGHEETVMDFLIRNSKVQKD